MGGRHAAMQTEDLFDGVIDAALEPAGRFWAAGFEVCEEMLFTDQIGEEPVGAAEAFMCVPSASAGGRIPGSVRPPTRVAGFGREMPVLAPPSVYELEPVDRLTGRVADEESAPSVKQGLACRCARVQCEMGFEVHPDMEQAALYAGGRPVLAECWLYPGSAVTHHDSGCRDLT